MARSFAWVIAGAVFAAAGAAHAQEATLAPVASERAELPWYQRFTSTTGLTETPRESDRLAQPTWTLTQRWGVTVDVREAQRVQGADPALQPDQAAVGAYYQFTPRVRLGGEVSLGARVEAPVTVRPSEEQEPAAGVRIQSAFRF